MSSDINVMLGNIEAGSPEDLSMKSFEAYQKSNFKETQKLLDKLKSGLDEKDSRYQQNVLITQYYAEKCKFPQKYLNDLTNLATDMVQITKAPNCSIKQVTENGVTQNLIQIGNQYQIPANLAQQYQQASDQLQGQNPGGQSIGAGVGSQQNQTFQQRAGVQGQVGKSSNLSIDGQQIFQLSVNEVNPVLLYNIAAMSYQLQQYGKSLSYLIEIIKNLEQVEEFLMIKSMFLMLQILYELKQNESAWPIIYYLKVKLREFQQTIQQKQLIRSQTEEEIKSHNSTQEESKSDMSEEFLDVNVLNKNSFCIINTSYLRKHAISPKNMNIHEYMFLLKSFTSLFLLQQGDVEGAQLELKSAGEFKDKYGQDPVKVKSQINVLAMVQHLGMVNSLKAQIHLKEGNFLKSIKTLTLDEKASNSPHPSCNFIKLQDENSKADSVYQKCQNSFPHYYFNNLGIIHLKLQKYSLAIFYFSKALKYVEKSQNGQPSLQNDSDNPNEHISHLNTQKISEILYNYGIALFKVGKFEEAFRSFEKASHSLRHHPRLWYYMGQASLSLNQQLYQESLSSQYQSDVFYKAMGFGEPSYTKVNSQQQHKRFILTQTGDSLQNLESAMTSHDQTQFEKLKQQQQEILKSQSQGYIQKQTKAQQKKEKLAQQQKQNQINMPPESMSLQSAIMYFQNALIGIEEHKQNEINYSLYIRFLLRQQHLNSVITANNERIQVGHFSVGVSQNLPDSINASFEPQNLNESEDIQYLTEYPQSQQDLIAYKQQIRQQVDKKYETLKKNILMHLCYAQLLSNDFQSAIKTGNNILRNLNPNAQTKFIVMQYLAEAYTMMGQTQQALDCLKVENQLDPEVKLKFDNVASNIREEKSSLNSSIIQTINISAINICAGDMDQAKATFDQALEALELKLQTTEMESKNLLPSYLVNLLVYFYIKAKNFKMARQLLKSRRYVLDTGHIETAQTGQISQAQKSRNKSKTLIRNFT
eukprot:403343469